MKRDMELVRNICLHLEVMENGEAGKDFIGNIDENVFGHHVWLLMDAGLVFGDDSSSSDYMEPHGMPICLTWAGHEFLDAARDETRWNKAKATVLEKAGAISFRLLQETLVALMRQQMGY